jgi:cation transport ATPase
LIGIVGIGDPLRPGIYDAVDKRAKAGVTIKMCTGNNVLTAKSISTHCGIFTPGGIIVERPVFWKLSREEMRKVPPCWHVLARLSPKDEKIIVKTLQASDEIVGITGNGTNDEPTLKNSQRQAIAMVCHNLLTFLISAVDVSGLRHLLSRVVLLSSIVSLAPYLCERLLRPLHIVF